MHQGKARIASMLCLTSRADAPERHPVRRIEDLALYFW
jgi:hypothetical protein